MLAREKTPAAPDGAIRALSALLITGAAMWPLAAQQAFTGRISDSTCGASHRSQASTASLTDRQCLLACIDRLSKYVLVDDAGRVVPIANQDAMGLPLYAGRPVRLTGERNGDAILVSKVEAIAAHLHLGHVMTNWRDTPGTRGFLPVAIDEARVAALHAQLAVKASSLDDIKLHAGHVLNALDPTIEPRGPGAGYGVKKALAGAQQHLDLAARADGSTPNITTNAAEVASLLDGVRRWSDEAIALAERVRAESDRAAAAALAADVAALAVRIGEAGLAPAHDRMTVMLRGENLLGAPR
jgi:hypothetical protein